MNLETAKFNMVEQQIRPWNVLDETILTAVKEVPRENFVPAEYKSLAFADINIPIGYSQVMMQPKVEARMIQAISPKLNDLVLEIGTGTGFTAALLARLSRHVETIELKTEFVELAKKQLSDNKVENVDVVEGDGALGWSMDIQPDCVFIAGSLPKLPDAYRQMLAIGGRLVSIIGEEPVMSAVLVERLGKSSWQTTSLFETHIPPLDNVPRENSFDFFNL